MRPYYHAKLVTSSILFEKQTNWIMMIESDGLHYKGMTSSSVSSRLAQTQRKAFYL